VGHTGFEPVTSCLKRYTDKGLINRIKNGNYEKQLEKAT
jgi:predicted transcriptional regulator of viral defense system